MEPRNASIGCFVCVMGFAAVASGAVPQGYSLIWEDEFGGSALDSGKWNLDFPGGRWGDGVNKAEAVAVDQGLLTITTSTELDPSPDDGGPYDHHIAVLTTKHTQLFRYGYFESRIQFNTSPGAWSAFWMLAKSTGEPDFQANEIDIVEHRAIWGDEDESDIRDRFHTAVHWNDYNDHDTELHGPFPSPDHPSTLGNGSWHTYGLLWTPDAYVFYFDGIEIWRLTEDISQEEHFLYLSTIIEDNSWAGDIPVGGYGSREISTTNMMVDYVRVYATPEPTGMAVLGLGALRALGRRRSAGRVALR